MFGSTSVFQSLERRCLMSAGSGVDGIGVLGDSYGDEYQFYAPDRSTAKNWVEQLAEDSNVRFGKFSSIDPAGPLNAGFEYNWAVSGATSSDMIADGQHLGVAAQVASGKVDLVTVFVGGNDLRGVFDILGTQGPAAAQAALAAVVPTVATNIGIAAGTILSPAVVAANPQVHLILTTIPKLSYLPEIRAALAAIPQLAPFVDGVDQVVGILNQQIQLIAAGNNRIAVADFAALADNIFNAKKLKVGDVEVNRTALSNPADDPTYFFLADGLHPGTIGQGLLADLFVNTANDNFGTRIESLSAHDILQNAGLKSCVQKPGQCPYFSTSRISWNGLKELIASDNDVLCGVHG